MSGEDWRDQLGRLKRTLRDIDRPVPPGRRAGNMPLTAAARLEVLADLKRGLGLHPDQPLSAVIVQPSGVGAYPVKLEALPVWELPNGRRVQAKQRPSTLRALSAEIFTGEAPRPPAVDMDEPSF